MVNDLIMPPVGMLIGYVDFTNLFIVLKPGDPAPPYSTLADATNAGAVTLRYGQFVNTVLSFFHRGGGGILCGQGREPPVAGARKGRAAARDQNLSLLQQHDSDLCRALSELHLDVGETNWTGGLRPVHPRRRARALDRRLGALIARRSAMYVRRMDPRQRTTVAR